MLVLTRKLNESILIGEDIVVTVLGLRNGSIRLGIKAPPSFPVDREEIRAKKSAAALALKERKQANQGHIVNGNLANDPTFKNKEYVDRESYVDIGSEDMDDELTRLIDKSLKEAFNNVL